MSTTTFQMEDLSTWTVKGSTGKACEEMKGEEETPFPGMCVCVCVLEVRVDCLLWQPGSATLGLIRILRISMQSWIIVTVYPI